MTEQSYRKAFERAKADLADALEREKRYIAEAKAAHEASIQLRRAVVALAVLVGEEVDDPMGLTEAVRAVVDDSWLTLRHVSDQVEQLGVSTAELKNPDASLLSVLNRLVAAGEIELAHAPNHGGKGSVKVWRRKAAAIEPNSHTPDDDIQF